MVLNLEPCATVTITVTASPENQVTLSSGGGVPSPSLALTFTPQDWNVPQTVTVRAVDDGVVEGSSSPQASVSLAHAASGGGYDGAAVDAVSVAVTDNDLPQVVVAESGNSTAVDEASTAYDTYTIHLGREPFDDVTVTVTVGDGQTLVEVEAGGAGTGVGSSAILVFTPSDWDVAQTIRVHPVNDDVVEGQHTGLISHAATGGGYDGCAIDDVTVAVADNDAGGVTIVESEDRTQVAEGGAGGPALDTYQVLLTMQPSGDVTITAAPSADLTVDNGSAGNTLVFTPVNWNLPQTITVAAVDDGEAEGLHTGTVSHTAAGGGYTGASVGTVTVFITDNDPGVVVTESGGATAVREGGLTDTYIIALSTQPAGTVTVTVTPDGQLTVDCGTGPGSPGVAGQVTFTTSDWSDPRTITVAAADDLTVEGVHAGVVTHSASSGDPDYDAIAAPPVNVTITDNDSEAPPYEPPPPAPEPGPEPATGVRVVDPARDTTLRFAELGLTIHFPAGFVAVEPGDEIRVSARAAGPPDPVTLEGTHRTAGGNFELTVVRYRAGTTTSVYEFARTVTAVVDLRATAPRGVVADKIGLYVWEAGSLGPPSWVYVHSGYDSGSGRLIARLAHASRFAALVATRTFDDIQTHWARQEIEVLTGRKVIQGVAPWAFAPGDLVTRAQFCALLVRALGLEVSTSGTTPFADVPATAWYAPEVRTAWEAGLATGSTGASFAPNRAITRQEIAVFLSRALEVTGFAVNLTSGDVAELLAPFSDAGLVPGWARGPFAQVLAQGIVRGRTSTTLAPGGTATRAEAAVMLKRLMARTMDVAATATGVLQVSDVGGRHFELIVAGQVAGDRVLGGQVYTLLVDPGNTALLADLEARVGATVTLAGTVRPEAITIYQRGVPFVVYAVIG
ncbi:MAG: S-layer homology domain-containing protein [Bacillota bacterium]|nr:MAG: S-layer homology domain-containing protein [Bacillota bacterium]